MTSKKLLVTLIFLLVVDRMMSQLNPLFYSLNTTNGLSYIGVNEMCVDKKGNVWIATGNGLNMFNGKTVNKYFATEYPQLQNSNIIYITCDDQNRLWILTAGGYISMLDEKRQMHHVSIYENNQWVRPIWIYNSHQYGISIYTPKGNYTFNPHLSFAKDDSIGRNYFTFLPLKGYDTAGVKGPNLSFIFDDDSYLLMYEDVFFKINYRTNTVEKKIFIPHITPMVKWAENELLVFDRSSKQIKAINLISLEQTYPFRNLKDQADMPLNADFRNAEKLNEDQYIFTTYGSGIYVYHKRLGTVNNYLHSFANPYSLAYNTQNAITVTQTGWVFLACNPNGISYFKINEVVNNQYMFTSADGKAYDGNIAGIATKDNNTYYIGTAEGMLICKRNANTTKFIDIQDRDGKSVFKDLEVPSVAIDNIGNVWATVYNDGLVVMNKDGKLIKRLRNETRN